MATWPRWYSPRGFVFHLIAVPTFFAANMVFYGHPAGPLYRHGFDAAGTKTARLIDASPVATDAQSKAPTTNPTTGDLLAQAQEQRQKAWDISKPDVVQAKEKKPAEAEAFGVGDQGDEDEARFHWVHGVPIPTFTFLTWPLGGGKGNEK